VVEVDAADERQLPGFAGIDDPALLVVAVAREVIPAARKRACRSPSHRRSSGVPAKCADSGMRRGRSGSRQKRTRTSSPRAAARSITSKNDPRLSGIWTSRSMNATVIQTRTFAASTAWQMRRKAGSPSTSGRTRFPFLSG